MTTTFEQFRQSLAAKKFAPVYFVFGEEEFVIEECTSAIAAGALDANERSFNYDVVYGADARADDVVALANAFPMMAQRRVVLVRDFEKLAGKEPRKGQEPEAVPFIRYIKNPSRTTVLVCVASDPDLRRSPYAQLAKHAVALQIKKYYERDATRWIEERSALRKKKIAPAAVALLIEHIGIELRALDNELEKLSVFLDERATISEDDVRRVVGISREATVFELEKAIGEQDVKNALWIMQRLLAEETPQMAIAGLTRFFTRVHKAVLALSASGESDKNAVAAAIGANPRNYTLIENFTRYARGFSQQQIDRSFCAIMEADSILKTTQANANAVMSMLVMKLLA